MPTTDTAAYRSRRDRGAALARPVRDRPDGATIADALRLRRRGSEWNGPCPRCGGTDRFHVMPSGLFGCRGCGDDAAGLFEAVMRACGCWDAAPGAAPWQPKRSRTRPENRREHTHDHKPDTGLRHVATAAVSASVPAIGTPAAAYLVGRGVWPEHRELAASVLWLPLPDVPDAMRRALHRITEPAAVVGLVLYTYRTGAGELTCAKCEALAANGERLHDAAGTWRRNYGARGDGLFVALDAPGGDWHLVEGEADALAIAASLEAGRVVCASGTSGWTVATCADAGARRIVLHPDNDGPGVRHAADLFVALRRAGVAVTIEPTRTDPAADAAALPSTSANEGRAR